MPQVVVYKGAERCEAYLLQNEGFVVIGLAESSDIVLSDSSRTVSRYHAALIQVPDMPGSYFVRDLGSLHLTRVGGESVERRLLCDGDVIEIGDYRLSYSDHVETKTHMGRLRVVS